MTTLTARDVARSHGVTVRTAQRWIARGRDAGSLTVVTALAVGGNGARQRCNAFEAP